MLTPSILVYYDEKIKRRGQNQYPIIGNIK